MIINLESGTLKLYNLNIVDHYKLKKIMFDIAMQSKKENRVIVGERIRESNIYDIDGTERFLYRNLRANPTGRKGYKGGFEYEESYTEYINTFDIYTVSKLYQLLGKILNIKEGSYKEEQAFESLQKISKYCDMKKFEDKKIFEQFKEEILKLFYIEKNYTKSLRELNNLYQLLYIDNKELGIFKRKDFMEKYKVHTYDLKNIAKSNKNCCE